MPNNATPTRVIIRCYQVGFGDCFLLRFEYGENAAGGKKHILIDFGSSKLPTTAPGMDAIADDIARYCGNKLDALVVTHRHLDHLSALAGGPGDKIKALKPRLVLQPWTEDPDAETDAERPTSAADRGLTNRSFLAMRHNIHSFAQYVLDGLPSAPKRSDLQKELAFIGERNLKNLAAVKNIQEMGAAGKPVYAYYGGSSGLAEILPGVKVHVLGPPTIEQNRDMLKMRKSDAEEYWHIQAIAAYGLASKRAAAGEAGGEASPPVDLFDPQFRAPKGAVPDGAKWFLPRMEKIQQDQLLELVRILDDVMNNTSLILLFEVGGRKLLFPGDAQIENWSYALKYASGNEADKYRALLKDIDVYKVGHHGSLNATPRKMLWENFTKKGDPSKPETLRTILSTTAGKHGKEESKTEVPRTKLVAALKKESRFFSTQDLKSKQKFYEDIPVDV